VRQALAALARATQQKNNVISDNDHFKIIDAAFPRIGLKLEMFFGHPRFVALMRDLKINNRTVPRAGFPLAVLMALDELDTLHGATYPHLQRYNPHPWH
jgi:hypothetical protein